MAHSLTQRQLGRLLKTLLTESLEIDKKITLFLALETEGSALKAELPKANYAQMAVDEALLLPSGRCSNIQPSCRSNLPFDDVSTGDWYYDVVSDMYTKGVMTGMNETTFEPETILNRAFMAAVLYRRAGYPVMEYSDIFPDVPGDEWYTQCVMWAKIRELASDTMMELFGRPIA